MILVIGRLTDYVSINITGVVQFAQYSQSAFLIGILFSFFKIRFKAIDPFNKISRVLRRVQGLILHVEKNRVGMCIQFFPDGIRASWPDYTDNRPALNT